MKIVVITNLYPPFVIGGYEVSCSEAVGHLRARGHEVTVLTSSYGGGVSSPDGVLRVLECGLGAGVLRRVMVERRNRALSEDVFGRVRPDFVFVWNPAYTSLQPLFVAQRMGIPVVAYAIDDWLAHWRVHSLAHARPASRVKRLVQRMGLPILGPMGILTEEAIDVRGTIFGSEYLKRSAQRSGLDVASAPVCHWGIEAAAIPQRPSGPPRRLIYAGQLVAHKGVATVIEALSVLRAQGLELELTIAGGTVVASYEQELRRRVEDLGLTASVSFTGQLPRAELLTMLSSHDILVFPSVWEEGLGLSLLEGMAAGLGVVATGTGGSAEIVRDGENALLFSPGDGAACAAAVARFVAEPALYERLRLAGRATAVRDFSLASKLDQVEAAMLGRARMLIR